MAAKRRVARIVLVTGLAVLVLAVAGFVVWTRVAGYSATPEAFALAQEHETTQGWYVFEPALPADTALIFYPGGLVQPAAYAPLMKRTSERGIMTVIVPMPLDLAVFGTGRAREVIAAYPGIKHWMIGGHSLGGSMAAEFVKGDPGAIEGLVFLASYSAESTDLSELQLGVVSIYGTKDGLAGDRFESSLVRLPNDAWMLPIDGGNHAQFGDYGAQRGDGTATITRDEQQALTAETIRDLADSLR